MTTFKVHEQHEDRDDAMVLEAETPRHAADEYARRFIQRELERWGPQVICPDYVILVRRPGGRPARFVAYPTPGGDVAVRTIPD
ncbi:hypothetical protein GobsT_64160 [Gemmata obscuriglobus]|uniref:Uncharacterized protein n=1 Tax=Gemmata obscuriglobus TaxID=114 RepID=A0A2Z3GPX9_9BACT|nr:hypothetical protein [Gemmata obscuriglobus]AWM35863.1 hypothetical protein C1280_01730 [Gemmata obscuriglobus]QEG31594.1 hypothetical protein GobsT_64160 [Gemmata obscuriglobus]VTS10936.1 unnamed protein product [Gemmata obscuriglobus UQM 2246]